MEYKMHAPMMRDKQEELIKAYQEKMKNKGAKDDD
jgi:hypothetical protein